MRAVAAVLIGAVVAVAAGIALAFAGGGLVAMTAWLALAIGTGVGALAFRQTTPVSARFHPVEWALFGAFALAGFRAFFWLLYTRGNNLTVLSPNNLGDLALHLNFIRNFASGVPFWPENPIFAGEPLRYPIGADFFNSLLLAVGVPVEQGLIWVGVGGCVLTAAALWKWGRGFAIAVFLFGGGLAGFVALRSLVESGSLPIDDYQARMAWKNLFLALFVTQRGLLFALPIGLLLLDDWRSRFLRDERPFLPWWAALLLYASLPLFSLHSFLCLSAVLVGVFAFASSRTTRIGCIRFGCAALLPATLCVALVTGGFGTTGGIHWHPGWLQDETPAGENPSHPAWFWLNNFGLYLVLWAGLAVWTVFRGGRETRAFVLPATLLFVACTLWSFAKWPWDNTKILIWAWLAVAPALWSNVLRPMPFPSRAIVCFVLFFTGAISLVGGLDKRHGYDLAKRSVVDATEGGIASLDPSATFACAPEYSHPLVLLGRKIAVGYEGHLWSHGIDYADEMTQLERLMLGGPRWKESAQALGVDYLYWGRPERQRYPTSSRLWRSLPVAVRGEGFIIYDLRDLPDSSIR